MSQWQPIETAPRDGTEILVWCESGCFKSAYKPNHTKGSGFGSIDNCCWCQDDLEPSHWMPIPEGPDHG